MLPVPGTSSRTLPFPCPFLPKPNEGGYAQDGLAYKHMKASSLLFPLRIGSFPLLQLCVREYSKMLSHHCAPKQEDPPQVLKIMHPHLLLRQHAAAFATSPPRLSATSHP
ncbi:hypothetical protein Pint_16760 [Pistacia integerrima]|uniref:Uncharacterized protein n=1 Tax=Pistacia integerrima TaxID=434235 RepID=A0ACC0ZDT0_9ROSI|nr:hypothetical protein Pint_16760 [Pistacia integerrima]